jgi:hypothetical protein
MKPLRSLGIAIMLLPAPSAVAQQLGPSPADDSLPTVQQQLKALTAKLTLTGQQKTAITPILRQLHDETLKIVADESLTHEQRLHKVRPWRYETNREIRALLNEDQKKKLDAYLQGPHPEMHGGLSGSAAPPPQS